MIILYSLITSYSRYLHLRPCLNGMERTTHVFSESVIALVWLVFRNFIISLAQFQNLIYFQLQVFPIIIGIAKTIKIPIIIGLIAIYWKSINVDQVFPWTPLGEILISLVYIFSGRFSAHSFRTGKTRLLLLPIQFLPTGTVAV